jgi:hypothetical protein
MVAIPHREEGVAEGNPLIVPFTTTLALLPKITATENGARIKVQAPPGPSASSLASNSCGVLAVSSLSDNTDLTLRCGRHQGHKVVAASP